MFGSLKITTIVFACLLTLSNVAAILLFVTASVDGNRRLDLAKSANTRLVGKIGPLGSLIKDIHIDVVQVQQFQQDFSATRGEDGLDDGLEEAAKFAKKLGEDVTAAAAIAREIGRADVVATVQEVKTAFDPYYRAGELMARTYAEKGTGAGNAMMPDYDKQADELQARIDRLLAARDQLVEEAGTAAATELDGLGSAFASSFRTSLLTSALVVVTSLAFAALVLLRVMRPIGTLAETMRRLAEGATGLVVPYTDGRDEIGRIARATDVFREAIEQRETMRQEREQEEEALREERRRDRQALADGFAATVAEAIAAIGETSGEIARDARTVDGVAHTAAERAGRAAAAVGRTDGNVTAVADAAGRLATAIGEVERQMHRAGEISGIATDQAGRTQEIVHDLSVNADRIGEIVGLINAVAAQTNLLALNATIEAARAGDAGRGFAVVATEVKALAAETARATDQIREQIGTVQSITDGAVDAIDAIGRTVAEIGEITRSIVSAVEEQGAATREISHSIDEAARDTRGVVVDIGAVDESTRGTTGATATMIEASDRLSGVARRLGDDAEEFLKRIRG